MKFLGSKFGGVSDVVHLSTLVHNNVIFVFIVLDVKDEHVSVGTLVEYNLKSVVFWVNFHGFIFLKILNHLTGQIFLFNVDDVVIFSPSQVERLKDFETLKVLISELGSNFSFLF